MKNYRWLIIIFLTLPFFSFRSTPFNKWGSDTSSQTQDCLGCHETATPGIVADWLKSLHSRNSFAAASAKPELERRVSAKDIPADMKNVSVGCYECHSLNADKHKDNFEHFGYKINVVVSPNDCMTCHPDEANQYSGSKKAYALSNLDDNPVYHTLVNTILGAKEIKDGNISILQTSSFTRNNTCYVCHGTEVKVDGMKKVKTDMDEIEVPNLTNWPNQGVGRINPDGSRGSCTSCHPRHSFAVEIARKPYTCAQCHLEPDVPAYNIYKESKHGNIYESEEAKFNWEDIPWKTGIDFNAPTCAVCHNALLVSPSGDLIAQRTHDFGSRLWVRIFGLVYSHPQPKTGKTYEIKNKDGLPLPATFTNIPASDYLISADEQHTRQANMTRVCTSCHSTNWANSFFEKMDKTNAEADKLVEASTNLLAKAWELKIADKTNPFDELIEQMWVEQWLFYANSIRYAAAMAGPDYAAFKNGFWNGTRNLNDMKTLINLTGNKK